MHLQRRDMIKNTGALMATAWLSQGGLSSTQAQPNRPQREFSRTTPASPVFSLRQRAITGTQPKSVTVSPDGNLVAVCGFGLPDTDLITLHHPITLQSQGTIAFEGNAVESVFNADSTTLYVSNFRRNRVHEIDVATTTVTREFRVGGNPKTMALSPDEQTLYVANWSGLCLSKVDLQAGEEVERWRTRQHPRGLVVHPDGRIFVACFARHCIYEFAPDGRLIERWQVCSHPRHLAWGDDPNTLYITCTLGSVGWWDIRTRRRIGFAPTGRNPRTLALSGPKDLAATANFDSGDVSVIDLHNLTHSKVELPDADQIVGLDFHPQWPIIYATSWNTNELLMLTP